MATVAYTCTDTYAYVDAQVLIPAMVLMACTDSFHMHVDMCTDIGVENGDYLGHQTQPLRLPVPLPTCLTRGYTRIYMCVHMSTHLHVRKHV